MSNDAIIQFLRENRRSFCSLCLALATHIPASAVVLTMAELENVDGFAIEDSQCSSCGSVRRVIRAV